MEHGTYASGLVTFFEDTKYTCGECVTEIFNVDKKIKSLRYEQDYSKNYNGLGRMVTLVICGICGCKIERVDGA